MGQVIEFLEASDSPKDRKKSHFASGCHTALVEVVMTPVRKKQQKFGILHTSECLTADVPCLDHLWDIQKDFPEDGQTKWHRWQIPRITYRSVCRVVIVMTDQITCGTTSHVQLGRVQ